MILETALQYQWHGDVAVVVAVVSYWSSSSVQHMRLLFLVPQVMTKAKEELIPRLASSVDNDQVLASNVRLS